MWRAEQYNLSTCLTNDTINKICIAMYHTIDKVAAEIFYFYQMNNSCPNVFGNWNYHNVLLNGIILRQVPRIWFETTVRYEHYGYISIYISYLLYWAHSTHGVLPETLYKPGTMWERFSCNTTETHITESLYWVSHTVTSDKLSQRSQKIFVMTSKIISCNHHNVRVTQNSRNQHSSFNDYDK